MRATTSGNLTGLWAVFRQNNEEIHAASAGTNRVLSRMISPSMAMRAQDKKLNFYLR